MTRDQISVSYVSSDLFRVIPRTFVWPVLISHEQIELQTLQPLTRQGQLAVKIQGNGWRRCRRFDCCSLNAVAT